MREANRRGLDNAMKLLYQEPAFDRVRLFFVAEGGEDKPDFEGLTKAILDDIRNHLITHAKAVAAMKRGI